MLSFTYKQIGIYGVIVVILGIVYYMLLNKKGVNKRNTKYKKCI